MSEAKKTQTMKSNWLMPVEVHLPLLEIFDESFFGITNLLTPGALIYGGSLIAAVHGEKIYGDIDIAVGEKEYRMLLDRFVTSMKWIQLTGNMAKAKLSGYKKDKAFDSAIQRISSFQTFEGAKAQIISGGERDDDFLPVDAAFRVTRAVDFSACSLAMDYRGNVYETIKDGWNDCIRKVLRIVRPTEGINSGAIVERTAKYIARGFVLDADSQAIVDKAKASLENAGMERFAYLRDTFSSFLSIEFRQDSASIALSTKMFIRAGLKSREAAEFSDQLFIQFKENFRGKKTRMDSRDSLMCAISEHEFNHGPLEADREAFESLAFDCILMAIDKTERQFS